MWREVRIGATFDIFSLGVDQIRRRLIPVPALLKWPLVETAKYRLPSRSSAPNCGLVTSIPTKFSDGDAIDYEGMCTGSIRDPSRPSDTLCKTSILITFTIPEVRMTLSGKLVQVARPTPKNRVAWAARRPKG